MHVVDLYCCFAISSPQPIAGQRTASRGAREQQCPLHLCSIFSTVAEVNHSLFSQSQIATAKSV